MNTKEKLDYIDTKINNINNLVLKNKNWKLKFENKGANNYCLMFIQNKKELITRKFDTYGSVIGCLDMITFMFKKAIDEKERKEK